MTEEEKIKGWKHLINLAIDEFLKSCTTAEDMAEIQSKQDIVERFIISAKLSLFKEGKNE